jgi:hypothetical protein
MLPLMRWRYSVADGTPLGVKFSFFDYVALAFILPAGEELLRRGKDGWPVLLPGFALGLVALAFRDRSPQFTSWFLGWFRAPKKLAAALAENAALKKQGFATAPTDVGEMPTSLKLQFGAPNTLVCALSLQNIWKWYAQRNFFSYVDKKTKETIEMYSWSIFITFDKPIAFRQIQIDGRGSPLPRHEVKDSSSRYAVVGFDADLVGVQVDIYAI